MRFDLRVALIVDGEEAFAQQLEEKEVNMLRVGVFLFEDEAEQSLDVERRLHQTI